MPTVVEVDDGEYFERAERHSSTVDVSVSMSRASSSGSSCCSRSFMTVRLRVDFVMREKLGGWSPIDVVDDVGGNGVVHGLVLAQVLGVVFNLGHAFQVIPEAGT
jgi:hypothetical protein